LVCYYYFLAELYVYRLIQCMFSLKTILYGVHLFVNIYDKFVGRFSANEWMEWLLYQINRIFNWKMLVLNVIFSDGKSHNTIISWHLILSQPLLSCPCLVLVLRVIILVLGLTWWDLSVMTSSRCKHLVLPLIPTLPHHTEHVSPSLTGINVKNLAL